MVRDKAFENENVKLGLITFVAVSFHCFKNDKFALNNLIKSFNPVPVSKKK